MRCLIMILLSMSAVAVNARAVATAGPATTSAPAGASSGTDAAFEAVLQMGAHFKQDWLRAYTASPLSMLSKDCFSRFSRDPEATPAPDEVLIGPDWTIALRLDAGGLVRLMARDLQEFLAQRMGVTLAIATHTAERNSPHRILLLEAGGGQPGTPGSFTVTADSGTVRIAGRDPAGLRDGVVRLIDLMGFREAPILQIGSSTFTPRVATRVGRVPLGAKVRDVVFLGHNAIVMGYHNLFSLSTSNALHDLADQRNPAALEGVARAVREAHRYGLKTYLHINSRLLDRNHPAFTRHPDARGAELSFGIPGRHALCSEHPLVKRYYSESIAGLFRQTGLDGVMLIVGGEEFYHCFMRPTGCDKGHTNCPRCGPLGAETVVANLANLLADAAHSVRPDAEVVVWPYGAHWCWSRDDAQLGMIERLHRGTALLVEPEVGEVIMKDGGIQKNLWDYSIDLIGPGPRCRKQIAACASARVPLYLKSDHEHAYEACRLPGIPCMDRWFDRTEAMIHSGADGLWVFSYVYRPCFGTSGALLGKYLYWNPPPGREELLERLAAWIAGKAAGPALRRAWRLVSQAVGLTPEIPPRYFRGPMSLGPEHPMCVDRETELPACFYTGKTPNRTPLFDSSPTGIRPVFARVYRQMEQLLRQAVQEMQTARPTVPARCTLAFDSEDLCIHWLYHTVRTTANFYESCELRDSLAALEAEPMNSASVAQSMLTRWQEVLTDEEANVRDAQSVRRRDVRLSQLDYYPSDASLLEAKLRLVRRELAEALPEIAEKLGLK